MRKITVEDDSTIVLSAGEITELDMVACIRNKGGGRVEYRTKLPLDGDRGNTMLINETVCFSIPRKLYVITYYSGVRLHVYKERP